TRFCRWSGQDKSGKKLESKMGKDVFPYPGCSDRRERLTDEMINLMVAMLKTSARRAGTRVVPMEVTDTHFAARIQTLAEFMVRNQLGRRWSTHIEQLAQWMFQDEPGVSVMRASWKTEETLQYDTVSAAELAQSLLPLVETEEQVDGMLEELVDLLTNKERKEGALQLLADIAPQIPDEYRKAALKSLAKEGTARWPVAVPKYNGPDIEARRVNVDLFYGYGVRELQRSPVIVDRDWLHEWEVRTMAAEEEWDAAFVKDLLGEPLKSPRGGRTRKGGQAGKSTMGIADYRDIVREQTTEAGRVSAANAHGDQYEILTVYWKAVDAMGVPGVYWLRMHGDLATPAFAPELLDDPTGEYPFIEFARERLTAQLDSSRSVAALHAVDQTTLKLGRDAETDHMQMTGLPTVVAPRNRPITDLMMGPGQVMRENRPGELRTLTVPDFPRGSRDFLEGVEGRAFRYYGLPHALVPAEIQQLLSGAMVEDFLEGLSEVIKRMIQLAQHKLQPDDLARILGDDGAPIATDSSEIRAAFNFHLHYDPRLLNLEYIEKIANVLNNMVLPMDVDQSVMRSEVAQILVQGIDPNLARLVTRSKSAANEGERKAEMDAFMQIAAGLDVEMQPEGVDFETRLATQDEIGERFPDTITRLAQEYPERFERLGRRRDYLKQGLTQLENANIGKTGAVPLEPEEALAMVNGQGQ
ncbi:MAG: hypothetical protein KDB61_07710, partial [Planctomycetes bacterium]|nr:hypothetical protein [Planctomycetota bacterium]